MKAGSDGKTRTRMCKPWIVFLFVAMLAAQVGFAQTTEQATETKVVMKLQDAHLRDAIEMLFKLKGGQFGYDLSEVEKAIKESSMQTNNMMQGGEMAMPGMAPGAAMPMMAAPAMPAMPAGAPGAMMPQFGGASTQTPPEHLVKETITIDIPPPGLEWEKVVFLIAKEANLKEPRREGKIYKFFPKPPPPQPTTTMGMEGGMMMPGMPGAPAMPGMQPMPGMGPGMMEPPAQPGGPARAGKGRTRKR